MSNSNNFIPTVAIVGKPNVGKSSLFNRLIRRRKAIVSGEPGVTRDINYELVSFNGLECRLADCAGFTKAGDEIQSLSQSLNTKLIDRASVIIFLCEISSLTAEDFDTAEITRKSGKPYIFVINKVDNDRLLEHLYDFFDLGLEDPIPVSTAHGNNVALLIDMLIEKLQSVVPADRTDTPLSAQSYRITSSGNTGSIDVAIVGKPNVGKSSLLNLLVNMDRSIVSDIPGTTRDSIDETVEYGGFNINFIDTAGLRKRKMVRENVEFYSLLRAREAIKRSSISIMLVDAVEGVSTQDKKIASMIVKEKKGIIIAANKWDIAKEKGIQFQNFKKDFYYFFPHISFSELVPISAKTGYNKIKLLKNILTVYNNYNKKIRTNELNSLLQDHTLRSSRIKYGFQKSTAPPVFELFVGKENDCNTNFKRFIINLIRKKFDLKGVPFDVILRIGK